MSSYSPLIFFSLVCITSYGQLFTKVIPQNAVGLSYSHNSWIDFDNDGDLDFLTTGAASTNDLRTILYENIGADNFRQAPSPFNILPQYSESEIGFLNLNGDDRIDILLMGRRMNTPRTSLLENRTTGFTDAGTISGFENAGGYGTISIGDVNNDARPDIFLSGSTGFYEGNPILEAVLYLHDNGTFRSTATPFTRLYFATSRFADLDNDKDLDLILSGSDGGYPYQNSEIYFNDGTGFLEKSSISLVPLQNPSIEVADYDADHDLDILMSGLDANLSRTTKLYRNETPGFIEVPLSADLNGTASGSAKWADYDNDSDFDILITGDDHSFPLALFQQADGQFTALADATLDTLGGGQASWGDYDSDGDLDILAIGSKVRDDQVFPQLYILKNGVTDKNTPPAAPTNLAITATGENSCSLDWSAATDDITGASSLTYNLSIRNAATGAYLQHPFSDDVTGKRRIMEQGNVWLNTGWNLRNIGDGIYTIKVQAIDGGLAASAWSLAKTFYAGMPAAPDNLTVGYDNADLVLEWTDNAVNEENFMIERKFNDGNFVKVDSVSGATTWREPSLPGLFTYRISAVNPNGASAFSNVVNILITETELTLKKTARFFPNPVADVFTLQVTNPTHGQVFMKVFDLTGSVIHQHDVTFDEHGETKIDTRAWAAGLYWVELRTKAHLVERMRLLKQ